MWPIISTIVLKLKDFLRLQVLRTQAVTYTVKHVVSWKWCKTDTLFLQTTKLKEI